MTVKFTYISKLGGPPAQQIKQVIPHEVFLNLIKPAKEKLFNLGMIQKNKLKPEELDDLKRDIEDLKKSLEPYQGEWCTDQSPLGLSIKTGIISLPESQGGDHKVEIEILSE